MIVYEIGYYDTDDGERYDRSVNLYSNKEKALADITNYNFEKDPFFKHTIEIIKKALEDNDSPYFYGKTIDDCIYDDPEHIENRNNVYSEDCNGSIVRVVQIDGPYVEEEVCFYIREREVI